jgi:hypothetical protein
MSENNVVEIIPNCETVKLGEGKTSILQSVGMLASGGLLGALGTHIYCRKRYSGRRNVELLLLWMIKNVHISVTPDELGLKLGPAKISFAQSKKEEWVKKEKAGNKIDDADIELG